MGSWGAGKPGWEAKLWEAKMASQTRNFEGGQHPNECRANAYDAALRTAENCIELSMQIKTNENNVTDGHHLKKFVQLSSTLSTVCQVLCQALCEGFDGPATLSSTL